MTGFHVFLVLGIACDLVIGAVCAFFIVQNWRGR